MKFRPSKFVSMLGAGLAIGVVVVWLVSLQGGTNVRVPSDFRVERQVVMETSGEAMSHLDIYIENGTLWYDHRTKHRKLADAELKALVPKNPWPANSAYTSDGGGDTALTTLVIAGDGEETRLTFDDAWSTTVSEEVLAFDAYLNELAGYPPHRSKSP